MFSSLINYGCSLAWNFFPTVRVELLFLVGLIFAYLQVQDSMDMKQIFMSIKYQAATNLTLLLK